MAAWSAAGDFAPGRLLNLVTKSGAPNGLPVIWSAAKFAEVVFRVRLEEFFEVRNPVQNRWHSDRALSTIEFGGNGLKCERGSDTQDDGGLRAVRNAGPSAALRRKSSLSCANLHRPYGTRTSQMVAFPTLKRGANDRCAYGAPPATLAIFIPFAGPAGP